MWNALLLTACLGGSHADLHPADCDWFLEIPDVPAVYAATHKAPLVRFLADERIRKVLVPLAGESSTDLVGHYRNWLTRNLGGAQAQDVAADARALSLSVRVGEQLGLTLAIDFGQPTSANVVDGFVSEQMMRGEDGGLLLPLPGGERLPLWTRVDGGRFVMGLGTCTRAEHDARAQGGDDLSGQALRREARAAFDAAGKGTVLLEGCQTTSLTEIGGHLGRLLGFQLPNLSLIDRLGVLDAGQGWRMTAEGKRFVTHVFKPGDERRVIDVMDRTAESIAPLDPDAMGYVITSFEPEALVPVLERRAGELLASVGLDAKAVAASLGPRVDLYMHPLAGLGLPTTFVSIEMRNPELVRAALPKLGEALQQGVGGWSASYREYKVKRHDTGERQAFPLLSLNLPPELADLTGGGAGGMAGMGGMASMIPPIAPCFTVTDDRLLVGISNLKLKRELKRLYAKEGLASGEKVLAQHGVAVPAGTRTLIVGDWGRLVGGLLSLVRSFAGMLGELPFDVGSLPGQDVLDAYFQPTVHVGRVVDGGFLRRHESSFGLESWGAVLFLFGN